jgi:hypothetical protein
MKYSNPWWGLKRKVDNTRGFNRTTHLFVLVLPFPFRISKSATSRIGANHETLVTSTVSTILAPLSHPSPPHR